MYYYPGDQCEPMSSGKTMIKMCITNEITLMDEVDKTERLSLRDLIVDIVYPESDVKIFHCISKMRNLMTHMFHFVTADTEIATMLTKGLIPSLRLVYGN